MGFIKSIRLEAVERKRPLHKLLKQYGVIKESQEAKKVDKQS